MPRVLRVLLVTAVAATLGCAEITYGDPEVSDAVLRTTQAVAPGSDLRGEMSQEGDLLTVHATRRCNQVEVREVRRTTRSPRKNEVLGVELALLGLGAIPASLGAVYLADAPSVYEDDRHSRTYNSTGPGGARAAGIALLGVGALIMAVPAVDGLRSIGSKEEQSIVEQHGAVLRADVPCADLTPAAGRPVTARLPDRVVSLGATDAQGRLAVRLAAAIPPDALLAPDGRMEIWIDQRRVGIADVAGVAAAQAEAAREREESAWRGATVQRCEEEATEEACEGVRSFFDRFPDGPRGAQARALLERAAARGRKPPQVAQVAAGAADPGDAAAVAAEAARAAAAKAAEAACRKECAAACKKDAACARRCLDEACR